jgi:hypothetical protein
MKESDLGVNSVREVGHDALNGMALLGSSSRGRVTVIIVREGVRGGRRTVLRVC